MSGIRILDAIALLRASSTVAGKHFAIRFSQAERFAQTSSLVKSVRDRRRPGVVSSTQTFSQSAGNGARDSQIPDPRSVPSSGSNARESGVQQDHHYDRSAEHSTHDPIPNSTIDLHQAKAQRAPLPDGTIPPEDSPIGGETGDVESHSIRPTTDTAPHPLQEHNKDISPVASSQSTIPVPKHSPLSSTDAKKLQRQYESQIPQKSAEPPSADISDEFGPEFSIPQEQDVFYKAEGDTSPVLSALPRVKVPKVENDVQGGDPHISKNINADVFYSGAETQATEQEPDEETLARLFHGRKASQLLRNSPGSKRGYHTTSFLRQQPQSEKEDLERLAADMAKDLGSSTGQAKVETSRPYEMRESRVPSSRVGRLFEYGGLAASMAFGAVTESFTKSGGSGGSLLLSPANMERLVAKLSKMRGAALKLGQMISFQDVKMLPKPIVEVLQRVQDSADYMPASQRDQVISTDLGSHWRDLFHRFEEKPMAAASIGQVHSAILKDGTPVAVKVQYPGVANSISSDLNNLSVLLNASKLLPKGLYLDKTIANARTELAWECDYVREAEAAKKFYQLLADEQDIFTVPKIIDEASGKSVLTMELMKGTAVTKISDLTQDQKDWIGYQILRLCLREIIEFQFMQTDPNWTNFLYNRETNRLELLDFGASREYPDKFVHLYVRILEAASRGDRKAVGDYSVELGYLTGYESKAMYNAHIDSVITLGEPFTDRAPDVYDFQDQTITDRVRALIPVMVRERLAPPPEETYSLHRKLSGAFLLCARLGSRVRCKELFQQSLTKAHFLAEKVKPN